MKIWPGSMWTRILVKDHADGLTKILRVFTIDDSGRWLASACDRAKGPMVLTVNPPENGEYELVDVEAMAS